MAVVVGLGIRRDKARRVTQQKPSARGEQKKMENYREVRMCTCTREGRAERRVTATPDSSRDHFSRPFVKLACFVSEELVVDWIYIVVQRMPRGSRT